MTYHITYDHECPECGALYIPYDKDVPCPRCGLLEEERFESFVRLAAESAIYNRRCTRRYTPIVWSCSCFADNLLWIFFEMFQSYVEAGTKEPFENFAAAFIVEKTFGDKEYLREYTAILACKVYYEIQHLTPPRSND